MFSRVLFPGRFQPVHNGHVQVVKWLLSISKEVIILVTAGQYNYTVENPFTAGERLEMLRLALWEFWDRLFVLSLDNIPDNSLWLSYVSRRVPRFEAVCTGNAFVKMLAEASGYKVLEAPQYNREELQGRRIREAMAKGDRWENTVPTRVAEYIKSIRGVERVKAISSSENVVVKL
ncbi:MAG: nicotinamide-nucleotide adenylyltransferase [Infirmifilum sp.]